MIFGLGRGIIGAAMATIIAQITVCALLLVAIGKDKHRPFPVYRFFAKPDRAAIRQIFRWSLPISVESFFFTLLSMVTSRFVASFGAQAMAVSRVGSQIESLSWLIGGGFGSALTAYVGQNFGAGKWSRIHKGYRISLSVMLVYGLLVTALLFFCGGFLFTVFLDDPAIVAMGIPYLRILAMCQLAMCVEAVASGCFKGVGRTLEPSVISFTSNALRVPLSYFLSKTSLGLNGIWWGICLGAILRGVWAFVWYMLAARKQEKGDVEGHSA
jgi:putative MATE family efflux protein